MLNNTYVNKMLETKSVRVLVAVILVTQLIGLCNALEKGDKGVCPKNVPGKRRAGREQYICCKKYEYDAETDKCMPICHQGCNNGTCVDVDTCYCEPPLTLVNRTTCVPSTCSNCEHGDCMAPNDCRCHPGYVKTNGTCTPVCNYICVNGICAEPNICKCNPGYKPDPEDPYKCIPICDPECVHGYCVAPNKCLCDIGYNSTENNSVCQPICDECYHGECVAPYNCSCDLGYERVNSTCQPKCSDCENGECKWPGVCQCHTGYIYNEGGCRPTCTPPCKNGRCVGYDQCLCNEGYNMTDSGCQPVCFQHCVNGECSSPNNCSCFEGYVKDVTDHSRCYKPCTPPCLNGTCDSHGKCSCSTDFEFDNVTLACTAIKLVSCTECHANCSEDDLECRCTNGKPCYLDPPEIPPEVASTTMAGLDLPMIGIGSACLFLLILVGFVMQRIWHKRNEYGNKPTSDDTALGSVVYTVPHTLIHPRRTSEEFEDGSCDEEEETNESLLQREAQLP